jgi:hypothetical protein
MIRIVRLLCIALLTLSPVAAHVGSPDVFYDGVAGPYPVLIVIRPPLVIPGTAQVEVRISKPGVRSVRLLPMPLTGPGSKFPPTADVAVPSKDDAKVFTGQLWMMAVGTWQVKVEVEGDQGRGAVSVPVPALATETKGMDPNLGRLLFGLMIFLVFGMTSIVTAAVRESTLPAGVPAASILRPKPLIGMLVSTMLITWVLYAGSGWWRAEAASYGKKVYKPLRLEAAMQPGHVLSLQLSDPGWLAFRKVDDLEPDHGHLMHLYALREPAMDAVFHLHPEQVHPGVFELPLPPMPAGRYILFADIVHEGGLGETPVGEIEVDGKEGTPMTGDNSGGVVHPGERTSELADGSRMVWVRDDEALRPGQVHRFVFRIEDAAGRTVNDLEPYMGMAGHAAFVSRDLSTFAHLHPVGSASMPALMLAAASTAPESMAAMHEMPQNPEVSFPYAFPKAGQYRIIVQMKRGGKVQTGAFDVTCR